jgi:hypothetical protein
MYSEYSGDCFYTKYDIAGQAWSTPINLSRSAKVYVYGERTCDIDVDGSNRVYVVWVESNVMKLSVFSGNPWSDPGQIASGSAPLNTPKIAASSEGNIYIGWWADDGAVYSRSKVNGAWEDIKTLSIPGLRSKFPDIAVGNQVVYMTWMEGGGGGYRAVYSKRSTAARAPWSNREMLPSTGNEEQHPVVVIDSNDNPHVVWTPELTGGGVRIVVYSRWTGNNFSSPEQISVETILHYPSLAVRGQTLYACWQEGSYRAGWRIAYNIRQNDEWKGESAVPQSGGSTFSDVGASPLGDAVYFVFDASGEICFASVKATPGNQLPVAKFTFSPTTGDYPLAVTFDASSSYDPDGKIVAYDWTFGDGGTESGKTVKYIYTKKGTYTVRLTVWDDRDGQGTKEKVLTVLSLYQPLNIRWQTFLDRTLFFSWYLTEVRWDKNSENDKIATIVKYRIYRKKPDEGLTAYTSIGEVGADSFMYRDFDVKGKDLYTYTITAIDSQGHESPIE